MIVQCGHCGAPLDVREGVSITTCRYCGKANQRQMMRMISPQTPPDFRPPRQWIPPPEFPAPSNVPLKYHSSGAPTMAILMALIPIVLGVGAAVFGIVRAGGVRVSTSGPGSILSTGATAQMLASLNLSQSPAAIAKALGGNPTETSVYVKLNDPRYEYVTFSWDEKHPDHPTGFYLGALKTAKRDAQLDKLIDKWLHGGLTSETSWSWFGDSSMHFDKDVVTISGHVQMTTRGHGKDTENPRWKDKLGALWKVALEGAFGIPATISQADKHELLGAGYPLEKLASIDPKTTVETAPETIQKMFPGSSVSTFISLDIDVSVEHPLFKHVDMAWKNEKNGPLSSVHFRTKAAWPARREAWVECLGTKLGKPEVREADYVNKKRDYEFRSNQVRLLIPENMAYIVGYGKGILGPDYVKIINAVNACQ